MISAVHLPTAGAFVEPFDGVSRGALIEHSDVGAVLEVPASQVIERAVRPRDADLAAKSAMILSKRMQTNANTHTMCTIQDFCSKHLTQFSERKFKELNQL